MMTKRSAIRGAVSMVALILALAGCGDDGEGGSDASDGVVTPMWAGYCTATFEVAHPIESFGEVAFTAPAGATYLLGDYREFLSETRVDLFYLTDEGPASYDVVLEEGAPLPFTSNCERDAGQRHVGVFKDVTVYEDEERSVEACQLSAGTAATASGGGFSLVSELFAEPAVYRVSLGGLSEQCGGLSEGYVVAKQATVPGGRETIVPIRLFIGPPQ